MTGLSHDLEQMLYRFGPDLRHTQDSPVLPSVWQAYWESDGKPVDLLLTPDRKLRPGELARYIRETLPAGSKEGDSRVIYNQSTVLVPASFEEMVSVIVTFSPWWKQVIQPQLAKMRAYSEGDLEKTRSGRSPDFFLKNKDELESDLPRIALWWLRLIGTIALHIEDPENKTEVTWLEKAKSLLPGDKVGQRSGLFQISINRTVQPACIDSIRTVKADAAKLLFNIDTSQIRWAVVDSGIDAHHEAFRDDNGNSRVLETYDFTRVRRLFELASSPGDAAKTELQQEFGLTSEAARRIRSTLAAGGDVDWGLLKPALRVKPNELDTYVTSLSAHGTHVAGIIGGCPKSDLGDGDFCGMCPQIQLIDVRILDAEEQTGQGEFDIIAALQFIRYLNSASDTPIVHGVNLSIQIQHDPQDYATGHTPICDECNRLVASGVVVVAAAGNLGIERGTAAAPTTQGSFRGISIADPGNADAVITVGSTHRKRPHTYGVSYFSSRGPTGDGRQKPDLVAPGEKILGPIPGNLYTNMEGTSMAAPHVSGAAALLLARYSELIGDANRVKQILCNTATDLGRIRDYQGAGLVDVLRALQSV